jgi:hypothetical protein
MTPQITVKLSVFLLVARNAELHLEIHLAQPVHRRNIPVTRQAVDLSAHVGNMPKLHKIGNKVDANPGDRHLSVQVLLLLLNLGMHRNYIFMAKKTLFHFRQSCVLSSLDIRMAEAAVDLLNPCMYPVAEIDWLDRSQVLLRKKVVEVEKGEQE